MKKPMHFVFAPGLANMIRTNDPNLLMREHGVIEKLCEHGVGHPVGHVTKWDPEWMGVHGCDGCCYRAGFYL